MPHKITPYINGNNFRDLNPEIPLVTKELYTARSREGRFGVDNLGRMVLRLMDGSRALPNLPYNVLLLGKQDAVQRELVAREWPVYALRPAERGQLASIGLGDTSFPPFVYQLPKFSKFYGHIGSQRDAPMPYPDVHQCALRDPSAVPRLLHMDRDSIETLGKVCNLEVRPHEFVGLPPKPHILVDDQLYSL